MRVLGIRLTLIAMLLAMANQTIQAQGITDVDATVTLLPSVYYSNEAWDARSYTITGDRVWWGIETDVYGTPPDDSRGRKWYASNYTPTNSDIKWVSTTAPYSNDPFFNGLPSYQWTDSDLSADIYIRRQFTLEGTLPKKVYLSCGHDDGNSEFYINDVLVYATGTWWNNAEYVELTEEQRALLKTDGTQNLLAMHVHNNYGGAFADCGLYAVPDVAGEQHTANLKMGYQKPWTARYIFNPEGGYAGNNTNTPSDIHGWEALYEAMEGDVYTIHPNAADVTTMFKSSISLVPSHRYTVSMNVLSDKDCADFVVTMFDADRALDVTALGTMILKKGVKTNVRKQGLTGLDIDNLVLSYMMHSAEGASIQISDISVFDSTDGEELWTGTSYYNYSYSTGDYGLRVKDPLIEGRHETMSWTLADFDDSDWSEMLMPVGNAGYIAEVNTIWPGGDNTNYWVRRDFELDEVLSTSKYEIMVCHDDSYEIYVNGHLIHADQGWTNGKSPIAVEVPARYLKVGRNVIATYIQQNWGGKFYDCGMREIPDIYEEGDIGADPETALIATEVEVSNIDQVVDYSFNYGSWLELYNKSDKSVLLDYLYISDDPQQLDKFMLPAYGAIKPGGYKCIFFDHNAADGTYGSTANRQVRFKLNTEGGSLYISTDGRNPFITVDYPADITRCSWARKSLTSNEWGYNGIPTPAAANADAFAEERLAAPVVDTDSRLFDTSFSINVEVPEGAVLYYTTDGTTPTTTNGKQTSRSTTFNVSNTTCYRFRLYKEGYLPSPVVTRSYIYRDNDYYLPVMNVTTNPDNLYDDMIGIYVDGINGVSGRNHGNSNINMDWERPVNVEYITPDGRMVVNQEAEMCISGGWSRHFAPSSFKLKATKLYEGLNSIDYPFFKGNPYKKYKQLLVRNGGNDNDSQRHGRVRDAITQEVLTSSGFYVDAQQYQPIHVFFNGKYIGQLNLREPNNRYNGTASYGFDDDEMDAFEYSNGYYQMAGTKDAFLEWHRLSQNAADPDTYEQIKQLVDVDEVINYFASITYIGCTDWICNSNNSKGYRGLPDGKFHLTVLDQDWGWGNQQAIGTLSYSNGNELIQIFNNMRKNADFQRQFVNAYCLLGGSVFTPERCEAIGDSICNLVEKALSFEGKSPWSSFNEQKDNMISSGTRAQRHTSLRNVFGLGVGMKAKFHANIPQATFMLDKQFVPLNKFDGTLYAPVTITASAPTGYVFEGWSQEGGTANSDIFSRNSQWQYWDEGSLDDYTWHDVNCNFTGWKTGEAPIGYGGRGDLPVTQTEMFHPTYYFRKNFTLNEEPKADDIYTLDLDADDGYIIYVNGMEAAPRYLMPEGEVTYETLAIMHAPDPYYETTIQIDPSLLHKGENVIAVEVHNNVATSSDIFWASSLAAVTKGRSIVSTEPQLVIDTDNDFDLTAVYRKAADTAPVRINEVSAGNDIYVNDYYKRTDWLELYNTTDKDIDLKGMFLSDNADKLQKYEITAADGVSTVIPANGTLLVWADKRDPLTQLHAPFKLENADGSVVTLQAADGSWTDILQYNEHDAKGSFGRYPNGGNATFGMSIPTIDHSNVLSTYDFDLADLNVEDQQVTNTFGLEKGWNWTSHNLNDAVSVDLYKTQNSILRSKTNELFLDSELGWVGNLSAMLPATGYKVKSDTQHDVTISGYPYDLAKPVSLAKGWNWIGCPLAKATVLTAALGSYEPSEGDQIVGLEAFAVYQDGEWKGTLTTLTPGEAYMLKTGKEQTFCWNALTANNKLRRNYRARALEQDGPWMMEARAFPDVMNLIATVKHDGNVVNDGCWVGAFCGEECRGLGRLEDGIIYMTTHGEGEQPLTFRVMDTDGEEYEALETTSFQSLQMMGQVGSPYVLNISEATDVVRPARISRIISIRYYTLDGQMLTKPASGVCIKHTLYEDGNYKVTKILQ